MEEDYRRIAVSELLANNSLRGFVASSLKLQGFKWFDPPTKEYPPGSEFTGENLFECKFRARAGKLFLRIIRVQGGEPETERVLRIRYPSDMGENYIFVDRFTET
jgi:hypothetical protein